MQAKDAEDYDDDFNFQAILRTKMASFLAWKCQRAFFNSTLIGVGKITHIASFPSTNREVSQSFLLTYASGQSEDVDASLRCGLVWIWPLYRSIDPHWLWAILLLQPCRCWCNFHSRLWKQHKIWLIFWRVRWLQLVPSSLINDLGPLAR